MFARQDASKNIKAKQYIVPKCSRPTAKACGSAHGGVFGSLALLAAFSFSGFIFLNTVRTLALEKKRRVCPFL